MVIHETDAPANSLTSALIGSSDIQHFASIQNVEFDDYIALVFDPDGQPAKANRLYWDTITNIYSESFFQKRSFIRPLIGDHQIHVCKDISNGGIIGTIYQLAQYCGKGCIVDLTPLLSLEPFYSLGYDYMEILSLFLTSAFIITVTSRLFRRHSAKDSRCQYATYCNWDSLTKK